MIRKLLTAVILFSSYSVLAQDDCPQDAAPSTAEQIVQHVQGCPNNTGIEALCLVVGNLDLDPNSADKYKYQSIIKKASCVSSSDSLQLTAEKIQKFWSTYGANIECNRSDFNVQNGSIVKYAIFNKSDSFIFEISKRWKVNLNKIDSSDNRTVLDYAYDELAKEQARNSPLVGRYQSYINQLKSAGAKRRSEL